MDCMLPADTREPTDLELVYIRGARGRFYRTRWDTVIAEPRSHSTWSYVRITGGTEVATATASGLPSAAVDPPRYFGNGEPIHRDQNALLRGELGAGERWIPAIVIVGSRLVHGWIYGIDLVAIGSSGIAGNALRYDIAAQRCANAQAEQEAAAERNAAIAAGLSPTLATTLLTRTSAPEGEGDERRPVLNFNVFDPGMGKGTTPPPSSTTSSGMGLAIVGTLGVVAALGLIVWAAGGTK